MSRDGQVVQRVDAVLLIAFGYTLHDAVFVEVVAGAVNVGQVAVDGVDGGPVFHDLDGSVPTLVPAKAEKPI